MYLGASTQNANYNTDTHAQINTLYRIFSFGGKKRERKTEALKNVE